MGKLVIGLNVENSILEQMSIEEMHKQIYLMLNEPDDSGRTIYNCYYEDIELRIEK